MSATLKQQKDNQQVTLHKSRQLLKKERTKVILKQSAHWCTIRFLGRITFNLEVRHQEDWQCALQYRLILLYGMGAHPPVPNMSQTVAAPNACVALKALMRTKTPSGESYSIFWLPNQPLTCCVSAVRVLTIGAL